MPENEINPEAITTAELTTEEIIPEVEIKEEVGIIVVPEVIETKEKVQDIDIETWSMHYMDKNSLVNLNAKLYNLNMEYKAESTIKDRIITKQESEIDELKMAYILVKEELKTKEWAVNLTHDKRLLYWYEAKLKANPDDLYAREKLWEILEQSYPWIIQRLNVQYQTPEVKTEKTANRLK